MLTIWLLFVAYSFQSFESLGRIIRIWDRDVFSEIILFWIYVKMSTPMKKRIINLFIWLLTDFCWSNVPNTVEVHGWIFMSYFVSTLFYFECFKVYYVYYSDILVAGSRISTAIPTIFLVMLFHEPQHISHLWNIFSVTEHNTMPWEGINGFYKKLMHCYVCSSFDIIPGLSWILPLVVGWS